MRRNPKGRNFIAKSMGHATSRRSANEWKCYMVFLSYALKILLGLYAGERIRLATEIMIAAGFFSCHIVPKVVLFVKSIKIVNVVL